MNPCSNSLYYSPVLYTSPYVVATPQGYTKHYFVENERIASRIGDGNFPAIDAHVIAAQLLVRKRNAVNAAAPREITRDRFVFLRTLTSNWSRHHTTYWQHGDHLGSAAWVTDTNGVGYQHLQYMPWGEQWVDQRKTGYSYNTRYTFSGKERDEETGFSYFGARYYQPNLSIWLSVDPMADKYPGVSPYTYCGDNPVKLVDPDGREIVIPEDPYTGSGWFHTMRRFIANVFNVGTGVNNLGGAVVNSLLQSDNVNVTGQALEKIKTDPAMANLEKSYIKFIKSDSRFGKENFTMNLANSVQFGGKRAPEPMSEQIKDPLNAKYRDTWVVAFNELTWLVRSTTVKTAISVSKSGHITMNHSFVDVLDLRPSDGRSPEYNTITKALGFIYHDVIGGNDKMTVRASWSNNFEERVR